VLNAVKRIHHANMQRARLETVEYAAMIDAREYL